MTEPTSPALSRWLSGRLLAIPGGQRESLVQAVRGLPAWQRAGAGDPVTLFHLSTDCFVPTLWADPNLSLEVCRVLGATPAQTIGLVGEERTLTLNESLHSRPATLLINLLKAYPGVELWVKRGSAPGAKFVGVQRGSIIALLMLSLPKAAEVTWLARGKGADQVLAEIERFNASKWSTALKVRRPVTVTIITQETPDLTAVLLRVMRENDCSILSGIFHVPTQRLIIGDSLHGHAQLAIAAGIEAAYPTQITRVQFELGEGRLRSYYPSDDLPMESLGGYPILNPWLAPLFQGIEISD